MCRQHLFAPEGERLIYRAAGPPESISQAGGHLASFPVWLEMYSISTLP